MVANYETRRREILEAAGRCFARSGFHQASMRDICEEVQMSPGGLYRYFHSKEQIIAAMIEEDRQADLQMIETALAGEDLMAGMLQLLEQVIGELSDQETNCLHFEILVEILRNTKLIALEQQRGQTIVKALAQALTKAQQEKKIDPTLDSEITAELLIAIVDGLWWRKALYPKTDLARYRSAIQTLMERLFKTKTTRHR